MANFDLLPFFTSILPNHLNMLKTVLWGALLVATSLMNTYKVLSKSDKNWPSYEKNTIILYAHIWAYATNIIDFGP